MIALIHSILPPKRLTCPTRNAKGDRRTMTKKNLFTAVAVVAALAAMAYAAKSLDNAAEAQGKQAPMFEVDPFSPKPLPISPL